MIQDNAHIFDLRNTQKKSIDAHGAFQGYKSLYIKERQIWYTVLGKNIWCEQSGKQGFRRPVLVMKKLWNQFLCIPLTTKGKDTAFYHRLPASLFHSPSFLLITQVKTLDKRRFLQHIQTVSLSDFHRIKKILREYYFPELSLVAHT